MSAVWEAAVDHEAITANGVIVTGNYVMGMDTGEPRTRETESPMGSYDSVMTLTTSILVVSPRWRF